MSQALWLTEDQRDLVRACVLSDDEARQAWERWRPRYHQPIERDTGRLLPLLYRNLAAAGVDSEEMVSLRDAYRRTIARNRLHLRPALEAMALLDNRHIPSIVLKGAAMTTPLYYNDIGARSITDVDLLIPHSQARAATELLLSSGWIAAPTHTVDQTLRDYHAINLGRGQFGNVDVHWDLLVTGRNLEADQALWSRAVATTIDDVAVRVLDPTDHLLHTCAHGAPREVRWITDVITTVRLAPAIDWDRLVRDVAQRRLIAHVHRALATVDHTVQEVVPAHVLTDLGARRRHFTDRVTVYPPGGTSRRQSVANLAVLAAQRSRHKSWRTKATITRDVILEATHSESFKDAGKELVTALRRGSRSSRNIDEVKPG
jgi:Uncharacterised nucleotidyltransferase